MLHFLALTVVPGAPVPRDDAGPVPVLAWGVIDTKRGFVLEEALAVKELKEPTAGGVVNAAK